MAVGVINFPASLDDADTLIRAANNAITTLASGITSGSTTISLTSATAFTTSGIATIIDNPASPTLIEIITYTGKSGNDLTGVLRGQYGTTASAFSAGATVVMRPVARHHTALVDLLLAIEQKIGYGTPLGPLDVSGTNQAGNNFRMAGGRGTGNAEPGLVLVKYPLKVASGTTLQALSSGEFPVVTCLYSNTSLGTAVANSTAETSLFTGASVSPGSTRTIEAGMTAAGSIYRLRIEGTFQTTGTPTIQFRIKFGTTVVGDSTAITAPNNSNGSFVIDTYLFVYVVGAAGSVRVEMIGAISPALTGIVTLTNFRGNNLTGVDFTVSQTLDVTAQWGTAAAGNSVQLVGASIERLR